MKILFRRNLELHFRKTAEYLNDLQNLLVTTKVSALNKTVV